MSLAPDVGPDGVHLIPQQRWTKADGELGHMHALYPRCSEVTGLVDGHDRRQHTKRLRHRRRPRQIQAGACKTHQAVFELQRPVGS